MSEFTPEQPTNTIEYFLQQEPPPSTVAENIQPLEVDIRFVFSALSSRGEYDELHEYHGLQVPSGTAFTYDMRWRTKDVAERFAALCNAPPPDKAQKKQFNDEMRRVRGEVTSDFERQMLQRFAGRNVGTLVLTGMFADTEGALPSPEVLQPDYITNFNSRNTPHGFVELSYDESADAIGEQVSNVDRLIDVFVALQKQQDEAGFKSLQELQAAGYFMDKGIDEINIWVSVNSMAFAKTVEQHMADSADIQFETKFFDYQILPLQEAMLRKRFGLEVDRSLLLRGLLQIYVTPRLKRFAGRNFQSNSETNMVAAYLLNHPDDSQVEHMCADFNARGVEEAFDDYLYVNKLYIFNPKVARRVVAQLKARHRK